MTHRDPAKQLAKEIADLRREVRSGASSSQMRFRAIEGGGIPVYSSDGAQTGTIGVLPDGTTGFQVIDGPKPVAPAAPILFPLIGGLEVTWNGETFDGSPLPGDFRCVEVHASPYSVYTPSEDTLRANLIRGGTITLALPAQAWTIMFVIRATSGMTSDPSIPATETPEHAPTEAELTEARELAQAAQETANGADARSLEAAGIAASKGTVYTQDEPPGADANGLWIDTNNGNLPHRWDGTNNVWAEIQDKGIQAAANAAVAAQDAADAAMEEAQSATQKADQALLDAEAAAISANGKNKVFWRASSNPPPDPLIDGDLWFVTDQGNKPRKREAGAWVDATFQDQAISGLNVGKLTTGSIAVGQRIIAGLITGTHAEMSDDGFRVFLEDPVDGIPDEIVRMGTQDNDIIGISDSSGRLLASIDSTGGINGQKLNIVGDPVFQGAPLSRSLNLRARGLIGHWGGGIKGLEPSGWGTGIRDTEYGVAQVSFPVIKGNAYQIRWRMPFHYVSWSDGGIASAGEIWARLIYRIGGTPTPTDHRETGIRLYSGYTNGAWMLEDLEGFFIADASGTATVMLALRHAWPSADSSLKIVENTWTEVQVYEMGSASIALAGGQSSGYGSLGGGTAPPPPPPPTQAYFVELAPSGWNIWRGDGTRRTDVPGPVQGPDPSGYNGDGKGHWWFPMPSITGTITNMEFYAYANHTYYNDGGDGLLTPALVGDGGPNYIQSRGKWNAGRWPKPGGRTVQLPSDWWPMFTNGGAYGYGRADGIRVGNGDGNLRNYVRFDGASARLRIWYTQ